MLDKSKLGTRYTCFQCGTRFYDLNRPTPVCPECSANQTEAPERDMRSLLGKGGRSRPIETAEPKFASDEKSDDTQDKGLLDNVEEQGEEEEEEESDS